MAGGPLAGSVPCHQCLEKGRVTRAFRLISGVESDQYLCWRGHFFGVDYRRGPAKEKQWPPPPGLEDALKK